MNTEKTNPFTEADCERAIAAINRRLKQVDAPIKWGCGLYDILGMYRTIHNKTEHPWKHALPDVAEYVNVIKVFVEFKHPEMAKLVA